MRRINLITDSLPEAVIADGREYPIDTDFRKFIKLEQMISDIIDDEELVKKTLALFFGNKQKPKNKSEAINYLLYLYKCGYESENATERKNGEVTIKDTAIYDYYYDAQYIFGAFYSQYGVDLQTVRLHWWKFHAMFKSLTSEHKIVEIMSIRATDIRKIKDKNERSRIIALKRVYNLPQNLTAEDKIARAGSAFRGMI